jgi:hypothetical protein
MIMDLGASTKPCLQFPIYECSDPYEPQKTICLLSVDPRNRWWAEFQKTAGGGWGVPGDQTFSYAEMRGPQYNVTAVGVLGKPLNCDP